MAAAADHVLLLGFGGPETAGEVRPFVERVTRGKPIPKERLEEVVHHYEQIGGRSPYNESVRRFSDALAERLAACGSPLPVFLGMRYTAPFLRDTLKQISDAGLRNGIAVVLAPHRSEVSFDRYWAELEEAKQGLGLSALSYVSIEPFFDHPDYLRAVTDPVREILSEGAAEDLEILFTAHSIPRAAASNSHYVEEFLETARLAAGALRWNAWTGAFQSRSGSPRDPWLEPDVLEVLTRLARSGKKRVLLVPIGFVCDNAEVLYDLDIEAREAAQRLGLEYRRARTVIDHPRFIQMMAHLIREKTESRDL